LTDVKTTRLANRVKHAILRHYVWIAILLLIITGLALTRFGSVWRAEVNLGVIGIPFTFFFVAHQIRLAETRLFKELFQEFNVRYDKLNNRLNRIVMGDESAELSVRERDVLYNYFNLCAEEFLFYKEGFIPEQVWAFWERGMASFFSCARIWKEWQNDPGTGSFYGFVPPRNDSSSRPRESGDIGPIDQAAA
jgi:hypothetical protein